MWPVTQETADLVAFTEEMFSKKLSFSCSVRSISRAPLVALDKNAWI